jgi:hypothetical protein
VFVSRERHKTKENLYEDSDVMKILKYEDPGSLEFYHSAIILVLSSDEIGATAWISLNHASGKLLLRISASLSVTVSE